MNNLAYLQPISAYSYDNNYYSSGSSSYGSSSYGSSKYSSKYNTPSSSSKKEDLLGPKNYCLKKDDILLYLYGKIVDAHRSCSDHDSCLKNDIKIVDDLVNNLGEKNNILRNELIKARNSVKDNDKSTFISLEDVLAKFKDDKGQWDYDLLNELASGVYPEYAKNKMQIEWENDLKASGRGGKAPVTQEAKILNEADLKKAYAAEVRKEREKVEREKQKQKEKQQGYSQPGYQQQQQPQQPAGGGIFDAIGNLFGGKK